MANQAIPRWPLLVVLLTAVAHALLLLSSAAGSDRPNTLKDKYHVVQVDLFTAPEDMQFPAEYLGALQDEIIKQLQESNRFTGVLRPGENPELKDAPVLQVTGTVTRFKPGSRAERYIVGFGAGATEVFGHLIFLDRNSGAQLSSGDVRGKMQAGLFGGKSINVAHDFAHRVGEMAKMLLEIRLPELSATPAGPATAEKTGAPKTEASPRPGESESLAGPSEAKAVPDLALVPTQRHVDFSSGDFEATQKRLTTEGAAGYRIVNFVVTGAKTADLLMEKIAPSLLTYEYVVMHGRTEGGLQKRINQEAAKGFRLVPNNSALFGGVFACIMEKSSVPTQRRYKYRLHATVRVSSAQRDIEKDQTEGYTLAGSATQPYLHIVLLEREETGPVPSAD